MAAQGNTEGFENVEGQLDPEEIKKEKEETESIRKLMLETKMLSGINKTFVAKIHKGIKEYLYDIKKKGLPPFGFKLANNVSKTDKLNDGPIAFQQALEHVRKTTFGKDFVYGMSFRFNKYEMYPDAQDAKYTINFLERPDQSNSKAEGEEGAAPKN